MRAIKVSALLLAIAAGGGAAFVAAAQLWFSPLPPPEQADRDQLVMWLVLRDLSAEPPATQHALVDRLQQELLAGLDTGKAQESLSESQLAQVRANVGHLKRVWFEMRVQQYDECPLAERVAFLSRQIVVVDRWTALDLGGSNDDTIAGFFDEIESWIAEADGPPHRRMVTAVHDGVVCWLATRNMADYSRSVRADLAARIIRELGAGLSLDGLGLELDEPQRRRLLANGELLLAAWLERQSAAYEQLDSPAQARYIDGLLSDFQSWGIVEMLSDANGERPTSPLGKMNELADMCIDRAAESNRPRVQALVDDLRREILARALRRFSTSPRDDG